METIVTSRFDYSALDRPGSRVRVYACRAPSSVSPTARDPPARSNVTYVRDGVARSEFEQAHCVLACYNAVIPHICRELPAEQRRALSLSQKCPLVYTNVLLRNWTAFHDLGIHSVGSPGCYHASMRLARPIAIGDYRSLDSARKTPPSSLMFRIPLAPGLSAQEQWRAGRADLLATTFETFEREIRDQLNRVLSAGGFDAARDIEAITVNRWPHGYAYGQDSRDREDRLGHGRGAAAVDARGRSKA